MKKIILSGLAAGTVMLIVGFGVGYLSMFLFPSLTGEYENTAVFRPWENPIMSLYFAHPFVLGIILAWVWDRAKGVITGASGAGRGLLFGLAYWGVTVPGMLMSYASFQVSLLMVITWAVSILAQALCAGLVYAAMNK